MRSLSRVIKAGRWQEAVRCLQEIPSDDEPSVTPAAVVFDAASVVREATRRAARIVADAEEQAARILREAENRAEELRRQAEEKGYEDGYAAGYAAGHEKARAEAEERVQHVLASLQNAVGELHGLRRDLVRQAEADMIKFAVLIAEKILRTELTDPERTVGIARSILSEIRDDSQVTVFLPSPAYDRLMEKAGSGTDGMPFGTNVKIAADPGLELGDVRIETEWGWLDGRGPVRWRRLVEGLERGVKISEP